MVFRYPSTSYLSVIFPQKKCLRDRAVSISEMEFKAGFGPLKKNKLKVVITTKIRILSWAINNKISASGLLGNNI